MTIHHDKLAYGRFAPLREDFSEERLEAMAKLLSDGTADTAEDAADECAAEKTDGTESEKDETDKTAKKNRA